MNIITGGSSFKNVKYLLFYCIVAVILFFPVLDKNFVSDDFTVLKRVCYENTIRIPGFFRPLSDWSIYLGYLISGFSPLAFNLFNILVHSINSFLLYQLCLKWKWTTDRTLQHRYAFLVSILFIAYPFHNEAIVWLLGRGASLATTFALLGLIIFFSALKDPVKLSAVCICYFIGLLAYESVIFFPLLIFILLREPNADFRIFLKWVLAFFTALIAHLIIRYYFSEALLGTYGEDLLQTSWLRYPENFFKVSMRLVIPPLKNSMLFILLSVLLICTAGTILFVYRNSLKQAKVNAGFALRIISILGCALIVPYLFAVSTRTSESDRLLYFPSVFVCCLMAFLVCNYVRSGIMAQLAFAFLCVYHVVFLELNNYNWYKAGRATSSLLQLLKSDTATHKLYIANLPNEINGAYVFREGLRQALVINNIDTSRIVVINKLPKDFGTNPHETWVPVIQNQTMFLPPMLQVNFQPGAFLQHSAMIRFSLPVGSVLYYWDQHKFVRFKLQ